MTQPSTPSLTVSIICDSLGRQVMADRLRVGLTAISNACSANRFPAKWFITVRAMCVAAGIGVDEALFNFTASSGVGLDADAGADVGPVAPQASEDAA